MGATDKRTTKTGGLVDYTGLAQVDGTPGKPELMLNSEDTKNFLELRDVLRDMSMQELTITDSPTSAVFSRVTQPQLTGVTDMSGKVAQLKNNVVSQNQNFTFGDTNINIDHVERYEDFVTKLQHDRRFEKMIQSMTVNRLVGKSSLEKYKYHWLDTKGNPIR